MIPAGDKGLRVMLPGYCKFVISAIGSDIFTFCFLTKRQIGLEMPSDRMPDRIAGYVKIKLDRKQLNNGKP